MEDSLRYPIGQFNVPENITSEMIESWIDIIEQFPIEIKSLTENLTNQEKLKTYREGGWTIAQVVHHCVDSHMNSYIRFKWTLTEDQPMIKAYFEDRWAELPDGKSTDISYSLVLTEALHYRWALLLRNLDAAALEEAFIHPDSKKSIKLSEAIGMYAWHCQHHLAHIKLALGK